MHIIIRSCVLFLWIKALTFVKSQEIKCSVPEIEHGNVTGEIRDYKEDEILHFECDGRYKKQADRPSKCIKTGTSAEFSPAPVCEPTKCKLSLSHLTGTTYDTTKKIFLPDETVGVTCNDTYWISTPQTTSIVSTCTESGEWDILPVCQEATCSVEGDMLVYHWSTDWTKVIRLGDTVGYQCRRGYRSTFAKARCTRDGWSPNPLCKVHTCNRFEVQHADIVDNNKQTYKYGEIVRYSCQEGYDGVFTLTCKENNRWSGDPGCREKGCTEIDIPHALIRANDRRIYKHNEQVGYTCENDPNRSFRVTCNKGNWTGIQTCQEIKCSVPEIEHSNVTGDILDYKKDEILYFECDRRYKKQTDRPSKCVKIGATPEFSPTPVCEPTTCTLSLSGVTGTRYNTTQNIFFPDETVGVTCSEWHWISTPQTTSIVSTCTESGEWDILPVCQEATCSVEEPLVYRWSTFWREVIRLGETIRYWCHRGYRSTSAEARCTRDGWSPNPLCKDSSVDESGLIIKYLPCCRLLLSF
ncbi:complement factor H-like isoform X2 [Cheilinus undulatus]|uniref:complement factor H-like isoform X2 n=1 Tax=Cheilinus undulatus TaxID=241271 RepID=UPI001BD59EBF|nr:complement factor H-like isoform X2 [Cheilinus undulatus]